ncbi:MAG TPA: LysM peptidoglycan-binding domain-containing protein [Phycisphaerae bacterium]|nr:LysM peptidoglycan-binding domain-containing protein [Phycisphaerae bacterium]HPS52441.1 LysM peptidoglycan-binding domain-containing protein [Phycisphaerae bacterium]
MQNGKMMKQVLWLNILPAIIGLLLTAGCASKPKQNVQMDTSELNPPAESTAANAPAVADEPVAPATAAPVTTEAAYKPAPSPAPLNPDAEKPKPSPRPIRKVEPATLTEAMNTPKKPAASSKVNYYIVRHDDTFWSISRRVYGSGKYWKTIQDANPDVSPERLMVGQKIVIPEIAK